MQTHIKEKHKCVVIRDLSWASKSMVIFLFLVSIFSGSSTSRLCGLCCRIPWCVLVFCSIVFYSSMSRTFLRLETQERINNWVCRLAGLDCIQSYEGVWCSTSMFCWNHYSQQMINSMQTEITYLRSFGNVQDLRSILKGKFLSPLSHHSYTWVYFYNDLSSHRQRKCKNT